MSTHHRNRVLAGVSAGGQFATGARTEPDVALVDRTSAGEMFMPDPNDYLVVARGLRP